MSRFSERSPAKKATFLACLVLVSLTLAACGSRAQRAQGYYEQGMSYLAKQDYVKASIEFKNALQLKGDLVGAFRGLAQIDEHNGNLPGLAGNLRSIAEYDPKDLDTRMKLGRLYLAGGALESALKIANEAVELAPQNPDVLAIKAMALLRLKDPDGATATAQKALSIDPANVDANSVLAATKFSQNDFDGALKTLGNIAGPHKEDPAIVMLEVNIYNRMGNLQQVETLLRRLIALHPKESIYRTQLIKFFVVNKRSDDALKELRAVTVANPNDLEAEIELVGLLGSTKGLDAARAELVARIGTGGRVFPFQIALARLDFGQGRVADSTAALEKLIGSAGSPDDAMLARTTLAEMYMAKNNIAAAEPLITEIIRLENHNVIGLRLRAAIHVERGQFDDAIADLRVALNEQPQSPELLAALGLAYERSGAIELADKAYFDATKAARFDPAVGLNYVTFLRRRGLVERAEQVLVDLSGRNPSSIPILSTLAEIRLARQDWVGAHAVAESIRNIEGKGDLSDQINGAAFSGEGKLNDSLESLQNAYNANPGAVQPMAALVRVYLQSKQTDKAISFLQDALKANPANAEALVLMGRVQLAKNDAGKAVENFSAAIKQQPKDVNGYRALADLYAFQRKYDDALSVIRSGIEQQPKNFDLHLTLAGLLEAKGEFEPAIAEYESLLKDQSGSMIVANNLASLLADHRTDKTSLDRANSLAAVLAKSDIPQFKDTIGWIAYQRADYTAAVSSLEDAVTKLPNNPLVHYHLGMAYLAVRQNAKATEQFKIARDQAPNDADLKAKIDAAAKS
jgi:tetratricopeptide (TPR) repeat protein